MTHFVGLDVSVKETSVCVVDGAGKVLCERKVPTEPDDIAVLLTSIGGDYVRVGIEAGPLSQWLMSGLAEAGLPMVCVETRHMKALLKAQQINKSDRNDARGIAQMMRVGLFKPVHVKTLAAQEQRMLLTSRRLIQRKLLDIECDMRGTLRNFGLKVGVVSMAGYEARIRHLVEGFPKLAAIVEPLLTVRRVMRQQLATLHKMLLDTVRHDPVCRRFMTAPGVGPVVALTYRASVDQPHRFVHSRAVGAHAGLTPKRHQSGETDYDGGISKCGDTMLRAMLYEAAQSMLTHSKKWAWLKAWGVRVAQRRGMRRATVAVARRLAVILHRMWVDGPTSAGATAPVPSHRQRDGTASLIRRSTGSASAGRCPHGDDGWREFVTSADPPARGDKDARKIEPLHPSYPIMRWPRANLEEKQEPRVATSVRANR